MSSADVAYDEELRPLRLSLPPRQLPQESKGPSHRPRALRWRCSPAEPLPVKLGSSEMAPVRSLEQGKGGRRT
eukprot:753496-Hanusia_phi.AAC.1